MMALQKKNFNMQIEEIIQQLFDIAFSCEKTYNEEYDEYVNEHGEPPNWEDPVLFFDKKEKTGWYWCGDNQSELDNENSLKFPLSSFVLTSTSFEDFLYEEIKHCLTTEPQKDPPAHHPL